MCRDWARPATSLPGLGAPPELLRRDWLGSPRPRLHRDWLGSPRPHLRRDRAHPVHICAGTGLTPPTSAPGLGSPAAVAVRRAAAPRPAHRRRSPLWTERAAHAGRFGAERQAMPRCIRPCHVATLYGSSAAARRVRSGGRMAQRVTLQHAWRMRAFLLRHMNRGILATGGRSGCAYGELGQIERRCRRSAVDWLKCRRVDLHSQSDFPLRPRSVQRRSRLQPIPPMADPACSGSHLRHV